ncbi:MAG: LVIVD repeat-containing protein [Actinomycetota bacterium]
MPRTRILLLSLALLASGGMAGAEDPGLPPAAGVAVASDNVDYVMSFPDIGAIGAKILGDTLYATTVGGVRLYDIGLTGLPILVGELNLPHWENEDVDTNGKYLFVAADHFVGVRNTLYVVDVQIRSAPLLVAAIDVPMAHTVTCVLGCKYLWLGGGGQIGVVDARNPLNPRFLGTTDSGVGSVHDVQIDDKGVAWVSGARGLSAFVPRLTAPLNPQWLVDSWKFNNNFIIHNSLRPKAKDWKKAASWSAPITDAEMTYVTEEDYLAIDREYGGNGQCKYDGSFQTAYYRQVGSGRILRPMDAWNLGQGTSGTLDGSKKGDVAAFCSSHYFDVSSRVASVAWYEQGVRFLSVSKPYDIRQVGYWRPLDSMAWAAKNVGEYVFVFDLVRGLDVIRFNGSANGPTVKAALNPRMVADKSEEWGWLCRIPVVA